MKLSEYLSIRRGAAADLARNLDIPAELISQWKAGRQVPAERCPEIEKFTNGKVTCEELRSDIPWGVLRKRRSHRANSDARAPITEYSDSPNPNGGNPQ